MTQKNIAISQSSQSQELAKAIGTGLTQMGHSIQHIDLDIKPEAGQFWTDADPVPDMMVWIQALPPDPTQLLDLDEDIWIELCENPIKSALDIASQYYEARQNSNQTATAKLVFVIPSIAMGGAEGFVASAGAGESIRMLAKSLAKAWGSNHICVHALALNPAHFVSSDIAAKLSSSMSLSDPALGHIGVPETDIAGILDLLCQEGSNFWTGATITADGGIWMAQ